MYWLQYTKRADKRIQTFIRNSLDYIKNTNLYSKGFSISEIDKLLAPYAEKSYNKYYKEYIKLTNNSIESKNLALNNVQRDMEQGFQGWEMKFNSVASSRGDYPKCIGALYSDI